MGGLSSHTDFIAYAQKYFIEYCRSIDLHRDAVKTELNGSQHHVYIYIYIYIGYILDSHCTQYLSISTCNDIL